MAVQHHFKSLAGAVAGQDLRGQEMRFVSAPAGFESFVLSAAGEYADGVLMEGAPEGQPITVANIGDLVKVRATEMIFAGDKITPALGGGAVRACGSGGYITGKALTSASPGDVFSMYIEHSGFIDTVDDMSNTSTLGAPVASYAPGSTLPSGVAIGGLGPNLGNHVIHCSFTTPAFLFGAQPEVIFEFGGYIRGMSLVLNPDYTLTLAGNRNEAGESFFYMTSPALSPGVQYYFILYHDRGGSNSLRAWVTPGSTLSDLNAGQAPFGSAIVSAPDHYNGGNSGGYGQEVGGQTGGYTPQTVYPPFSGTLNSNLEFQLGDIFPC